MARFVGTMTVVVDADHIEAAGAAMNRLSEAAARERIEIRRGTLRPAGPGGAASTGGVDYAPLPPDEPEPIKE